MKTILKTLTLFLGLLSNHLSYAQNFVWAKSMGGGAAYDNGYSIALDASGNLYTSGVFNGTTDFDFGPGIFNLTSYGSDDIFISKLDTSGNFVWAKSMGGSSDDNSFSIAVDASGNIYTTGFFSGTADFDPNAGVFNLTSAGGDDIFISKLDPSGNLTWIKSMGGSGDDKGISIALDASGNIYTTGTFTDTADFDPDAGVFNLNSAGGDDIFISKLDASGNFIWAKSMGSLNDDNGSSIVKDTSGNIYITGSFQLTVDFDPGPGTSNLTAMGNSDIFIFKSDASGNFLWAKRMGGFGNDNGSSIVTDVSGNVYSTGSFSNTVDFDPGAGTFNLISAGSRDIFISKLDASGNFLSAKSMGGTGSDEGRSIVVNASGNVFITGDFSGTADFNPGSGIFNLTSAGSSDIFISKSDMSGNFIWAKALGGAGAENSNAIALDASDRIYTTGDFRGIADFDPSTATFNLTSAGDPNIFISKSDVTGNFLWAKNIGKSGGDDFCPSIGMDASGNVYTTGCFEGTADFDPGPGTFILTSAGSDDIFISKLDPSGNFVWAKRMGDIARDVGASIRIDASGNIYTTGYYHGTVDFDPGPGIFNLTSVAFEDIFISKLDASGNFVWAKSIGGIGGDGGISIAVDASGNVYTTGSFQGTADFDPGTGVFNLTIPQPYPNAFISKLDASGNFVWAKVLGGTGNYCHTYSLAVDGSGNVYTSGGFQGTADFDPGPATFILNSLGDFDIFISKLNSSGNFVWVKSMGGSAGEDGISVTVDASGNVYTTGYFEGTADFNPGTGIFNLTSVASADIFISKLNSSGNFLWARSIGGNDYDEGRSLAVDASGNIYITGSYYGTVDFDPGTGNYPLASAGNSDIFISKLDASGNFVWAKSMGGNNYDLGLSLVMDASGNVYTTGLFLGTCDFDPGASTFNLTSEGGYDIFVHKISQTTVGLSENLFSENIVVNPNPTSGSFIIEFENPKKNLVVQLYSLSGQLIESENYQSTRQIEMKIKQPAGVYLLEITENHTTTVWRIMKE